MPSSELRMTYIINEFVIKIQFFALKLYFKVSFAKFRPYCSGPNVVCSHARIFSNENELCGHVFNPHPVMSPDLHGPSAGPQRPGTMVL